MQWTDFGLYNAKAIKSAKKKAYKSKRKQKKLALAIALSKRLPESEIQAEIARKAQMIAQRQADKILKSQGIEPPKQASTLPSLIPYRKGMGNDFYRTREWRQVRYQAIVKHGKVCQCCGSTQGYLHVDHIKPRSKYPELELEVGNLQILCEPCNIGKGNQDMTDWR